MNRNETIKKIRDALKKRSGKSWSVTGGRGTGYGRITIDALPARRTRHYRLKGGALDIPENYESYEDGNPGGYITESDRQELKTLLGLDTIHDQGEHIPGQNDFYQEYIDRAERGVPRPLSGGEIGMRGDNGNLKK